LKTIGVVVFAIGVGSNISQPVLEIISQNKATTFNINNFSELQTAYENSLPPSPSIPLPTCAIHSQAMKLPIADGAPKKVIVAVDFGTSFSGFAYSLLNSPTTVYKQQSWPHSPMPYCKTLSQVLYAEEKVVAWGYSAPIALFNSFPEYQARLFKFFKMGIHQESNPSGLVSDVSGTVQKAATQVITDY